MAEARYALKSAIAKMIADAAMAAHLQEDVHAAHEENRFGWYELAFWNAGVVGQAMEPFDAPAAASQVAFQPVMARLALAWPVTELDRSEFIGRWLGWFGDAATGTLQRPMMMPERQCDGSGRTS